MLKTTLDYVEFIIVTLIFIYSFIMLIVDWRGFGGKTYQEYKSRIWFRVAFAIHFSFNMIELITRHDNDILKFINQVLISVNISLSSYSLQNYISFYQTNFSLFIRHPLLIYGSIFIVVVIFCIFFYFVKVSPQGLFSFLTYVILVCQQGFTVTLPGLLFLIVISKNDDFGLLINLVRTGFCFFIFLFFVFNSYYN